MAFRFDFEGCGDSEGEAREITVEKEVSDLKAALKTLLKECGIDSRRIAFVGESLGSVVVSLFVKTSNISAKTLVF